MRVFITGGSGFIGMPLCKALAGHDLMVLSRSPDKVQLPFRWQPVQADLADVARWQPALKAFQPHVCVHLAWAGLPDYSFANNTANFHAGLQLLQVLAETQCERVIVTGTCFEYGDLKGCVSEEQVPVRQSLFASFKAAQRLVACSQFSSSKTALIWARPFFVYGPGQRSTSLIPTVYRSLTGGSTPTIGTPDAIQDFIHVDDVAHALAELATSQVEPGTYNLGTGQPTRVRDLVNLIARKLGRADIYPQDPRQGDGFWADLRRTRQQLRAYAPRNIRQGVEDTIQVWSAQQRQAA